MEALLTYWLKANAVLVLFAATYYGLLRRLTFFRLNRTYLLFALGFAAVYPLLPMPALLPAAAPAALPPLVAGALPLAAGTGEGAVASSFFSTYGYPALRLALALYLAGVAALLLRLLGQLLSLAWLRHRARPATVLQQTVRVVPGAGGPFSFGSTIYLAAGSLSDAANLPAVLRHEQAHVRQWHTLDVLLWQVATALAWLNPAAWLLRRAALDTLEYLADEAALHDGRLSRRAYQYLLLHQQTGTVPAPALAFHVELLTLKNRIAMLNQPPSASRQLGRYLLAAPLVATLALAYTGARAQTAPQSIIIQAPGASEASTFRITTPVKTDHVAYYLDGKPSTAEAIHALKPDDIASIDIVKNRALVKQYTSNDADTGVIFVTTKTSADSPAVLALADKADLGSGYLHTPASISAVVPKALAYITSHYPNARLSGEVTELKKKTGGEVKYQVQLAEGRRPFYVYFTPAGDFLSEQR